jgi:hypothetical protein
MVSQVFDSEISAPQGAAFVCILAKSPCTA